jgi:acyl transferase domain-containing protein
LASYLDRRELLESDLQRIAYTLQVGREPMEERLATVVTTLQSLREKLARLLDSAGRAGEHWHRGSARRTDDILSIFDSDQEFGEGLDRWLARGNYDRVLELWVKGVSIDWQRLHGSTKPLRISLPTYPFARERYWVDGAVEGRTGEREVARGGHPLLQSNESNAFETVFGSRFGGEEFFLRDHRVRGSKHLPGVAHLEMGRAAIAKTLAWEGGVEIRDVVWLRPVKANGPSVSVRVRVEVRSEEEAQYGIYTVDEEGEEVLHSQGVGWVREEERESARVDVEGLRKSCEEVLGREPMYEAFVQMGLEYGAGHRGIVEARRGIGEGGREQVLAQLRLPEEVAGTQEQYVLHPSVLDSALQAGMGLKWGRGSVGERGKPLVPFALESLRVYGATPSSGYAWVRYSAGSSVTDAVQKLDVSVCDEQGRVAVEVRGLSARVTGNELDEPVGGETVLFEASWEEALEECMEAPVLGEHRVLMGLMGSGLRVAAVLPRR